MKNRIILLILAVFFCISDAYAQPVSYPGLATRLRNGAILPTTCSVGNIFFDTDATSGQRIYACESANTWALQGDGGAGGGDSITVNTTAATNANFLDNLYIDWALDTAATPDDITSKFNYAETLAGNPALLTTECVFTADGLLCEGTTADTIEIKLAFPDPAITDKTLTLPNATDTLVGKATTDTLTNKTLAAADNVIDADTAVALAADPADCGANTFATTIAASGALTCASVGAAYITDGVIDGTELASNTKVVSFGITIDGGGSAITTGVKGYIEIPFAMTITGWTALADQSGSIVVDVWKDTYANRPPAVADTIAGTEKPTITTETGGQDLSLSSWTTAVTAGDIIGFNVDSITTVQRVHIIIRGNKS